jgi:hypothetical protein
MAADSRQFRHGLSRKTVARFEILSAFSDSMTRSTISIATTLAQASLIKNMTWTLLALAHA